jgi:mono/diheme cytochrome c family protein
MDGLPVLPAPRRGDPALECKTCHDPHVTGMPYLQRRTASGQRQGACLVCHPDSRFLDRSLHGAWVDPSLKSSKQVCGPCHAVHAVKGSMALDLWSAGLSPAGRDFSQQQCLACHGPAGPGKVAHVIQHPDVMVPPAQRIENIGPVGPRGIIPRDRITCITCHLPHGQMPPVATPAGAATSTPATEGGLAPTAPAATTQPTLAALRASKPMVRMDVSSTVCSMCHGFDAARRFLYYHKPQMRQGGALPFVPAGS